MELQPTVQHWESINLIFKLSALKDKLQVTWLPRWTHACHPRCRASPPQLHRLQLSSKPWLLGEPCFAGRSLPPSRSLLQKTVLGPFQLTAAAKTAPRRRGSSFLHASQLSEETDGHLPQPEGSLSPQPVPALPVGLVLRPAARPPAAQEGKIKWCIPATTKL